MSPLPFRERSRVRVRARNVDNVAIRNFPLPVGEGPRVRASLKTRRGKDLLRTARFARFPALRQRQRQRYNVGRPLCGPPRRGLKAPALHSSHTQVKNTTVGLRCPPYEISAHPPNKKAARGGRPLRCYGL